MTDDFPMPDWATGLAKTPYDLGASLPTRDGRKMGNATIVGVKDGLHVVVTDAGTRLVLTCPEVDELFWPPKYVMDPKTAPGVQRLAAKLTTQAFANGTPSLDDWDRGYEACRLSVLRMLTAFVEGE